MYEVTPIGYVHCQARYRYEAPRQAVLAQNQAEIRLTAEEPAHKAGLDGLDGFDRIWVIFVLHLNETWHAYVEPPHEHAKKVGVFATRSPHRPNRIGMSCVELQTIHENTIVIRNHDLLDLTPVLDIKPYIPYADAFPEARTGWVTAATGTPYTINFSATARTKASWLFKHGNLDAINFANVQLQWYPTDTSRKRITPLTSPNTYVIGYRTWRLHYSVNESANEVLIWDLNSGYSEQELAATKDRYHDKDVHRAFRMVFTDDAGRLT